MRLQNTGRPAVGGYARLLTAERPEARGYARSPKMGHIVAGSYARLQTTGPPAVERMPTTSGCLAIIQDGTFGGWETARHI